MFHNTLTEDGTVFQNIGKKNSDAWELPRRKHKTFRTQWKFEIKNNFVIILSWFLLSLSNSPNFLAEGLLIEHLACLCHEWTADAHLFCSSSPWSPPGSLCRSAKGRLIFVSGAEEPCLANWSATSFPSTPMCPGTHSQLDPVMFCQFHHRLMAVTIKFIIDTDIVRGFDGCLSIRKTTYVSICVDLSYILHYTYLNVEHCSL